MCATPSRTTRTTPNQEMDPTARRRHRADKAPYALALALALAVPAAAYAEARRLVEGRVDGNAAGEPVWIGLFVARRNADHRPQARLRTQDRAFAGGGPSPRGGLGSPRTRPDDLRIAHAAGRHAGGRDRDPCRPRQRVPAAPSPQQIRAHGRERRLPPCGFAGRRLRSARRLGGRRRAEPSRRRSRRPVDRERQAGRSGWAASTPFSGRPCDRNR